MEIKLGCLRKALTSDGMFAFKLHTVPNFLIASRPIFRDSVLDGRVSIESPPILPFVYLFRGYCGPQKRNVLEIVKCQATYIS